MNWGRAMAWRTILPAVTVAAGVAAATPAFAQDDAAAQEDAIALCRSAEDRDARIACLEAVVRGETPSHDNVDAERRSGLRLPFLGGGDDEDIPVQTGVVPSNAPEADAFGAEHVAGAASADDRPAPPRLVADVVAVSELPRTRLQVELDNGQIWRQTTGELRWDPRRHRDPEQVEIWRSGFGGYRMRVIDQDLVLRVERVR